MESLLLDIGGLPIHPLVVHAAVVTIPLAAVALLLGVILYRRSPRLFGVAVIITWVAAGAAILASQSGEALAGEIGITSTHQQWGELMGQLTIATAVVATLTWFIRRRGWQLLSLIGTLATFVAAPALLVVVFLAGHSGAQATWGATLATTTAGQSESVQVTNTSELPAPTAADSTASDGSGITLADVANHPTVDDCWVAVDGTVYDLSGYATAHPGGDFRIAEICGTDATDAFRNQHGNQGSPNRTLAGFEMAPLTN
jgi:predicted heme/steroid binding protein